MPFSPSHFLFAQSEVYSVRFSPNGESIATCSRDKLICALIDCMYVTSAFGLSVFFYAVLWKVYGDCENYLMLQGHKNAVLEVAWSHDNKYASIHLVARIYKNTNHSSYPTISSIYSASADKTVGVWDVTTGRRKLRLSDHKNYVNSVAAQRAGSDSLVSASGTLFFTYNAFMHCIHYQNIR